MITLVWFVGLVSAIYVIRRARKPRTKIDLSSIFDKYSKEAEDWNK